MDRRCRAACRRSRPGKAGLNNSNDGVKIYHPGLRRGITRSLRAMIRSRSATEPAIGHMKADGKLDQNWLKGALSDAIQAVLCGAGP